MNVYKMLLLPSAVALLVLTLAKSVEGQSITSVRLVSYYGSTSSSNTAGRLEVYYSGRWGTVCDDGFGASEARTACCQLGFTTYNRYGSVSTLGYSQASSSKPIWLDNLSCTSTATTLSQCSHSGFGSHDCTHSEDVAISCSNSVSSSSIRLVSSSGSTSSSNTAGRLEVYYNRQWGTVCDDGFGAPEARTACRQLGFTTYIRYGSASSLRFSSASSLTPIWLDDLDCSSSATSLSQCSHNGYGNNDCSHSEDVAIYCRNSGTRQSITSVRLVSYYGSTSSSNTAGRLEVYYNRQWGTVCDDGFGAPEARTACRQLGFTTYSRYGSVSTLGYSQASSSKPIWLDNLSCTSTATTLSQCSHSGFGVHDCTHSEDVAISCSNSVSSSSIRLVSSSGSTSSSNTAGRLEVYYNRQWGTVCDDGFGAPEARTACRQLGFTTYIRYGSASSLRFSSASSLTPIWLDDLDCSSSATSLSQCSHNGYGNNDCSHSEDVALYCRNSGTSDKHIVGSIIIPFVLTLVHWNMID